MANIPGEIVWQANDNTWFTTNAAEVYPAGITIYHVDGRYKFTDGVTALSALSFLGGGSGVQSVTGSQVDNTDPLNPVVNTPNLYQVLGEDTTANNLLEIAALNRAATSSSYSATFFINFFHGSTGTLLKMSINSFIAGIRTNLDLVYTTTSAVATQITTALSGYLTAATAASIYQKLREVISSNKTAVLDEFYTVNSTCTFTDPTPSEGKGYTVFVINGTVTVGGVAYSALGTMIERIYHSGAWISYLFIPDVLITKASDSFNTIATGWDIPDLAYPMLANSEYFIEGKVRVQCSSTGGHKFATTAPAGTTIYARMFGRSSTSSNYIEQFMAASGTLTSTAHNVTSSGSTLLEYSAHIITGSTSGDWKLQIASGVAGQTSTVLGIGTSLVIRKK